MYKIFQNKVGLVFLREYFIVTIGFRIVFIVLGYSDLQGLSDQTPIRLFI